MLRKFTIGAALTLTLLIISGIGSATFAQGKSGSHGGGQPTGNPGGGPPSGSPGVDRGMGNASSNSGGRSDDGLGTASDRSKGRSDAGIDRARLARANANAVSDNELNRYRGLSRKLGTTPEAMRAAYMAALLANPDLKYGQFVAANVVADNLNGRFSGITSSAILAGLANGDSLGRTLRNLGVGSDEAKQAEKAAKRQIKESKNNH